MRICMPGSIVVSSSPHQVFFISEHLIWLYHGVNVALLCYFARMRYD